MPRKPPPEAYRSRHLRTRLGRFMDIHHVKASQLQLASCVSRQHIYRLRYGLMDPTMSVMLRLRDGCIALLDRRVWLSELFDCQEDDLLMLVAPPARSDDRWLLDLVLENDQR